MQNKLVSSFQAGIVFSIPFFLQHAWTKQLAGSDLYTIIDWHDVRWAMSDYDENFATNTTNLI